jgi:hypothetical protein
MVSKLALEGVDFVVISSPGSADAQNGLSFLARPPQVHLL